LEFIMAARSNWKGYLKLSLVSCAVALYPAASSSSRVSFNTLNRHTGNKVKRQFIDPQTEEPVDTADQVKGYAVGKNTFLVIEDEDLDQIKIESTHTIDIEGFVDRSEVDERYFEAPYYIAPEDKVAQEAFAVIRDAMREKGKAGLARVVISRRERMILLEPFDKGLLGTVLRYQYEVRDAAPYFEDIPDLKLPAEMKELAEHIIERKSAPFDPSKFEDRYENAVVEMIKAKQAGTPMEVREAPRPTNVVNIMDALRRSIEVEKAAIDGEGKKRAPSKSKGAKLAPTEEAAPKAGRKKKA
jgi:DNA end-binding protein Ku